MVAGTALDRRLEYAAIGPEYNTFNANGRLESLTRNLVAGMFGSFYYLKWKGARVTVYFVKCIR